MQIFEQVSGKSSAPQSPIVYQFNGDIHSLTFNIVKDNIQLQSLVDKNTQDSPQLPKELSTPEAKALFDKLIKAKLLNEHYQPLLGSDTKNAILGATIVDHLDIGWKVLEEFWHINDLINKHAQAQLRNYYSDIILMIRRAL